MSLTILTSENIKLLPEQLARINIPKFVRSTLRCLNDSGFQAYIVGGVIRDICLDRPVTDWDITTSASNDEIRSTFRSIKNFTLKHDTVTLVNNGVHYEITSFRGRDNQVATLKEDLGHRDFTLNAMALDINTGEILDLFGGLSDISKKVVRCVGNPKDRFREDPLRLLRGVRISGELGFRIGEKTLKAIPSLAELLSSVAEERIRDELISILMTDRPSKSFSILRRTGLLGQFLGELLEGYLMRQNAFHGYTVYRHIMETVDRTNPDPILRLTALLHDIAKPRVRKKENGVFKFLGHEEASAVLTKEIMKRLRFSKEMIEEVSELIAHHMIKYEPNWSDGAVRRLIRRVGPEKINRMLSFRKVDLLAHEIIDHKMDYLEDLKKRVAILQDRPLPNTRNDLAVDGDMVMDILGVGPGKDVGKALSVLMEQVTDNPELNTEKKLISLLKQMRKKREVFGRIKQS
ncbi:MAG: HD domain-containing protein [Deltaproteobacteria bacterium]|nr:HD domain-containing protein [Deltaproteobacteria bacterium]